MPEGPEVRLTIDFLQKNLENKIIKQWTFCGGKYTDEYPVGYSEFDKFLPAKILNILCKGKFIYFTLYNNTTNEYFYILHSLMLTGRWQNYYDDHCKCFIELYNDKTIWFRDTRSFATFSFTNNLNILQTKLDKLGPDIMTKYFTLVYFKNIISKHPNRNITSFLMDQNLLSGVGNYIKAEVLFYSKLSPLRKLKEINEEEIELLYEGLIIIPRISYNFQGVTLKDFADENGNYSKNKLKIYGHKNAKKTKTPDGRTTYWDPSVQN
tara:strand:- start:4174 stop:4971 length:798 start_codon:yes stop_codon:yes gene_type:complete